MLQGHEHMIGPRIAQLTSEFKATETVRLEETSLRWCLLAQNFCSRLQQSWTLYCYTDDTAMIVSFCYLLQYLILLRPGCGEFKSDVVQLCELAVRPQTKRCRRWNMTFSVASPLLPSLMAGTLNLLHFF